MDKLIEMCAYIMVGVMQLRQLNYDNSFEIHYLDKKLEYILNYVNDTVTTEINIALDKTVEAGFNLPLDD